MHHLEEEEEKRKLDIIIHYLKLFKELFLIHPKKYISRESLKSSWRSWKHQNIWIHHQEGGPLVYKVRTILSFMSQYIDNMATFARCIEFILVGVK